MMSRSHSSRNSGLSSLPIFGRSLIGLPPDTSRSSASAQARPAPAKAAQLKGDAALVGLLRKAVEAASDDDGWAPLAAVGNIITNQRPDFDSRSYGYGKLSDLITATTLFEIERRGPGDGKQALMYAREKRRAPAQRPRRATVTVLPE